METIGNFTTAATNAASKVIWGQGTDNTEPIAGEQGAGTASEPFDKGNEETKTSGEPNTTGGTTGGMPEHNKAPASGVDTDKNRDGPSEAQSADTVGDPKSGQAPEAKQQGADKPADIPTGKDGKPTMPHTDSQREALVMKGEFPHDPNDHSGEPLKMHSGADGEDPAEKKEDPRDDGKKDRSASVAQEGGDPHGEEKKGTGEKVVKASGLAADGGDFDATKPGAGQEATRLLEEKGVHKTKPADAGATSDSKDRTESPSGSDKAKVSKMQKLKEKLHIGSGKKLE